MAAHLPKEQLIAFGQGLLDGEAADQVEQHLEVCPECCETLLDLKADTFVDLVRNARGHLADEVTDHHLGRDSDPAATAFAGKTDEWTQQLPIQLTQHPRYRIVELIGRGGMGNVYRAEHRLMNRPVAI